MADEAKGGSAAEAEDVLPIKKTGNAVYIAGGVGLLIVLGLVFGTGGDDEGQKSKAASSEKSANAAQGMTKEEAAERVEHLKRTQAALVAAADEENAEAKAKQTAAAAKAAEEPPAEAPSQTPASAAKPTAKPQQSAAAKKKQASSLDGLGADITSALK